MLRLETSYDFRANAIPPGGGNFVMATGDSTGYSLHGDFFNGFSVADGSGSDSLLNRALKNCPDMQGEARTCDVFHFQDPTSCHPEMGIVNESVGEDHPIDKLPGNNPVWCAEDGKATDPDYVETGTLISATPLVPLGWSMVGCLSHPDILPYQDDDIGLMRDESHMTPEECIIACSAGGYSHSETYCGGEGYHMSIYAADNQNTNGTYVPVEDPETEVLGPTIRPDSFLPMGATSTSFLITATPVFSEIIPPDYIPSITDSPLPTPTLPQPLGAAPPVSDSAFYTPYPSSGAGLKNIDDSAAFVQLPSATAEVTVTVTVTATQAMITVAPTVSWADGVHSLAPAAVYTDHFWTSDVLQSNAA
ncbi:hypothetical protein QFC22_002123 [Naganishia vaughanmartiniae]|uniref:Uncharacterized protein n=1 Tax=Naganishia vaughanmartiniae TaxID=1424756 RepID=A0ACC2XD00_9TREE|nr:hypothetical protein QFC22_002123 [Naganishia vaughanmartiniae]